MPSSPFVASETGHARLLAPIDQLDYYDQTSVPVPLGTTALDLWNAAIRQPVPFLSQAFWLRDVLSKPFGVEPLGVQMKTRPMQVAVGDKIDFFTVEEVSDKILCLTSRDKHLDVLTCVSVAYGTGIITSSVVTHNLFGKAYMLPVGIVHRWIVEAMFNGIRKDPGAFAAPV